MSLPLLTFELAKKGFFEKLQEGDIFEYSMNDFTYRDVKATAFNHGIDIDYCKPGTYEYNSFGCFVCQVIGFADGKGAAKVELQKFDPKELML
jgi:hypothetical protein